jgi:hypothetical protein
MKILKNPEYKGKVQVALKTLEKGMALSMVKYSQTTVFFQPTHLDGQKKSGLEHFLDDQSTVYG